MEWNVIYFNARAISILTSKYGPDTHLSTCVINIVVVWHSFIDLCASHLVRSISYN